MDLRKMQELGKDKAPDQSELASRERVLVINYTSPDGEKYRHEIVSRIMDGDERLRQPIIASELSRGRPWSSLPADAQLRFSALSACSVQLKDPPAWLNKWLMEDNSLLFVIYAQLQEHESEYFRFNVGAGSEDSGDPRISVSTVKPPASPGE
jgi:hypothetical protein